MVTRIIGLFNDHNVLFVILAVFVFMLLCGRLHLSITMGQFKLIFDWPGMKKNAK